uniref:NADH dehydrogenase subunit 5 n=1 Tax=Brugia timori TaxID=42155 RepID=A0A0R3QDB8_9BILA
LQSTTMFISTCSMSTKLYGHFSKSEICLCSNSMN